MQRKVSARTEGAAIAAATVLAVWTHVWGRCTSWFLRYGRAVISPFFVTERSSEAALIQVVQEAFVQGVSTRKMEKLAQSLGIENLSRSQVSEMTKGLNEWSMSSVIDLFSNTVYPVLWVDALYEKVRVDGRIVSMAILIVFGVEKMATEISSPWNLWPRNPEAPTESCFKT